MNKHSCIACARLRQLLAGTLLVAAAVLGLRAAEPAAPASAATPAPPPIAFAPALAASASAMQLVFRTVTLPSGRRGQAYGPHQVVRGGVPPYRVLFNGSLPPGLELGPDGMLRGTPTRTGGYRFTLLVLDTAHPQQGIEQPYVLYVNPPADQAARAASAPASAAAPPRPALRSLTQADIDVTADPHVGQPASYKLTRKDLEKLLPEESPAAAEPPAEAGPPPAALAALAAAEPVRPAPTAEQLHAVLEPLIDVEYPTRALFDRALDAGRCAYYRRHVQQVAQQHDLQADDTCPPPPPVATPRRGAAPPGVALHRFHEGLLQPATREAVVRLAEKRHAFGSTALRVDGGGCGCAPQRSEDEVIGFLPYWSAAETPVRVDFSIFTRLAFMGVVLGDDGSWAGPPGWDGRGGNFAREARRHGTHADLVLYRRDWASLLRQGADQVDAAARAAARNAVQKADVQRHDLGTRLNALLLPGWRESTYVYDGVTVFFEDSPTQGPQRIAFARFMKLFLHELVDTMRKSGRAYQINIVVPEQQLGEDGAYNFADLMGVLQSAEKDLGRIIQKTDRKGYGSPTGLSVAFLLLVDAPIGPATTALRGRIDGSPSLSGDRRMAFLESVVPVLLHRRGDAPQDLSPPQREELASDMAYIQWSYAGVGLWPAPSVGVGAGRSVHDVARDSYARAGGTLAPLCDFACPNRLPLRLLYQVLMLTLLAGIALYAWDCRVQRFGRPFLIALWVGALATLGTALLVFNCDPLLAQARDQGYGLYALILLLIAVAGYVVFKPKVGVP
jgi:hypothetical protein